MRKTSSWLYGISTGWVALAGLVIFFIFTATVLPSQAAKAEEAAAGAGSPDLSFTYYPAATLYQWADQYGASGRQAYVRARFTFDLAWPVVYTIFLVTSISWTFGRGFPPHSPWRLANLLPLAAVLFDLLENISASLVIARFPLRTAGFDSLAGVFTLLKWFLVFASSAALLVGIFAALASWLRRRQTQPGQKED